MCKGSDGKVGVRVKDVSKGIFVSFVKRNSPAALAGKFCFILELNKALMFVMLMVIFNFVFI